MEASIQTVKEIDALIINWVDNRKTVRYLASYDGAVVDFCII
jgi:hypothetical protein